MKDEEIRKAFEDYDKYRHYYALEKMFTKAAFAWEDFNVLQGAFVWLKLLLCILLKRWSGSYLDKHSVCVMTYDEWSTDCGSNWESVWISPKLFSGWQCCVCSDGT